MFDLHHLLNHPQAWPYHYEAPCKKAFHPAVRTAIIRDDI